MESLNEKLTELQAMAIQAQRLATQYHEWQAASILADCIENIAQAKANTRETAIATVERFIYATRLAMDDDEGNPRYSRHIVAAEREN